MLPEETYELFPVWHVPVGVLLVWVEVEQGPVNDDETVLASG